MNRSVAKPLPIFVVTGPSAAGKSIFVAEIARKIGGEVVNCDSMQVYNRLPILTNQPSDTLKSGTPHHLFSCIDPIHEVSHVESWSRKAASVVKDIHERGKLPIICGGTGLYIQALIHGISPIPDIPKEIRNDVLLQLFHKGVSALHHLLSTLDPHAAQVIQPCDTTRVVRAVEVWLATKRSIISWHEEPPVHFFRHHRIYTLLISPDRTTRHQRTDERTRAMFEEGIIEEVRHADIRAWRIDSPLHKAIGLQPLLRYIEGKLNLEDAILNISTKTKQYGKRQMTWFRHHLRPDAILSDEENSLQKQEIAILLQHILSHFS